MGGGVCVFLWVNKSFLKKKKERERERKMRMERPRKKGDRSCVSG